MSDITLESLIQEHKDRIPLLQENSKFPDIIEYPDMGEYYKWISKTTRFLEINFPRVNILRNLIANVKIGYITINNYGY